MPRILFSSIIVLALLVSSCEKVIDFDASNTRPTPVLNAIPTAGQQLFVNYSYTRFFLDTVNSHPVGNVNMVVTANGQEYRPVSINGSNYFFDYTPQEDDQLSIHILSDAGEVAANTYIPRMPRISNPRVFVWDTVFNMLTINFDIDEYDTIDTTRNTFFFCQDKALTDPTAAATEALGGYIYTQLLTTDKLIDGQRHNTTIMMILLRDTNEVEPFIHEYTLNVESVTPERYQYLQDIEQATSIMQLITEPAPVYSNVNGALGIFAGSSKVTFPLPYQSPYTPAR